ncbi:hypothetical protein EYR40_002397 [Pleurotus pulmonarius]|nr:hypothetical protein EYR40_002397 [Pleurotus pulmonarius]
MHTMLQPAPLHALKTFHELVKLLPPAEQAKPQILILAGGIVTYRDDTDREIVFRQESNFYYLSGCQVPGSYLVVVYQAGTSLAETPSVHLFIPKAELADMMWSVPPPSVEDASKTHDVTKVDHTAALPDALETLAKAYPDALCHTLPRVSPLFPNLPGKYTDILLSSGEQTLAVTDAFLLPALQRARLTKTEAEIAAIRQANQISSRAHEVVMRVLGAAVRGAITKGEGAGVSRPLLPGEWLIEKEAEAEAIFVASCRREGSVHQAYLPIVAASTRASTLHYCCNDREFAWGPVKPLDHHNSNELAHSHKHLDPQVLLIDAGCEWNCYASDITRTMPVGNGGKFTPEARAIYELVLEMQKESMKLLKPGLHWDDIQLLCHRVLIKGFQALGIFKSPSSPGSGSWNSAEAILASGISSAFFPHGVGHSLGMDVHDVPEASKPTNNPTIQIGETKGHESFYSFLRLRLPLEKNMVVTVEPGCYFSPHLIAPVRDSKHINTDVLKRYEGVGGVRIEDVVLITEDGYENLTTVLSDVAWIEGNHVEEETSNAVLHVPYHAFTTSKFLTGYREDTHKPIRLPRGTHFKMKTFSPSLLLSALYLASGVFAAFDLSQIVSNTNCVGPTLLTNTTFAVANNKIVYLSTVQCSSFAAPGSAGSMAFKSTSKDLIIGGGIIIRASIWNIWPLCILFNTCNPPKPPTATSTKTIAKPTSTFLSESFSSAAPSSTLAEPTPIPSPPPSGPVHVCSAPCATSCDNDAGVLPPVDEDCEAIDNAIEIFSGESPQTFVVAPQHVETLSSGTCSYFFVNYNPVPASAGDGGNEGDIEACWSDLVWSTNSLAVRKSCFPPAQPFTSGGLCTSSDKSWAVGAAHS